MDCFKAWGGCWLEGVEVCAMMNEYRIYLRFRVLGGRVWVYGCNLRVYGASTDATIVFWICRFEEWGGV